MTLDTDLDAIEHLAAQLARWAPPAFAQHAVTDGIRSTATDRAGGRGSVLDDQGDPMPPVSDPVGELVANATAGRPNQRQHDVEAHVAQARRSLAIALSLVHQTLPAPNTLTRLKPTGDPGCTSCKRIDAFAPATRAGRCDWCYRWWLAENEDPPVGVLEARARGDRITTKIVAQARADSRRRRRRTRR